MSETARWLNLSLYQGAPAKKGLTTLAMAASTNPLLQDKGARDPTLFCTAYKKQRFYIFSRSEPEDTKGGDRDIFNEKPTREEQNMALAAQPVKGDVALGSKGVIHTTKGDIVSRRSKLAIRRSFPPQYFQLYPDLVPKTVENFVTHAKNGYYNGIIFHRIIQKFVSGHPLSMFFMLTLPRCCKRVIRWAMARAVNPSGATSLRMNSIRS